MGGRGPAPPPSPLPPPFPSARRPGTVQAAPAPQRKPSKPGALQSPLNHPGAALASAGTAFRVTDTIKDANTDGRLEAWELLDLDINADVAVLSACQTASGLIGGGEGVVGHSWALFAAGASTAVVSQWEVDSASTTSLMLDFHQRLLDRKPGVTTTSDALRQAAVHLMKDPRFRHPFYWAGFIVMGAR